MSISVKCCRFSFSIKSKCPFCRSIKIDRSRIQIVFNLCFVLCSLHLHFRIFSSSLNQFCLCLLRIDCTLNQREEKKKNRQNAIFCKSNCAAAKLNKKKLLLNDLVRQLFFTISFSAFFSDSAFSFFLSFFIFLLLFSSVVVAADRRVCFSSLFLFLSYSTFRFSLVHRHHTVHTLSCSTTMFSCAFREEVKLVIACAKFRRVYFSLIFVHYCCLARSFEFLFLIFSSLNFIKIADE